jgi:hypothetical protein
MVESISQNGARFNASRSSCPHADEIADGLANRPVEPRPSMTSAVRVCDESPMINRRSTA